MDGWVKVQIGLSVTNSASRAKPFHCCRYALFAHAKKTRGFVKHQNLKLVSVLKIANESNRR